MLKTIGRALCGGALVLMMLSSQSILCAQPAPRRIEVMAKRFTFEPGDITIKKGQPVLLVMMSKDVAHGVRFRELNVELRVRAGGTGQVLFTPNKTGDFVGHCSVFCGSGHGTMMLKLHVVN